MNDYSKRETNLVYDGRYPEEKNEITIAGILAERIGKKINDTVTVTVGDKEKHLMLLDYQMVHQREE